MKTRAELIKLGKIWHVGVEGSDELLFEGSKPACKKYIKDNHLTKDYKAGLVRLGQLVWEP
jgi:hypothetical protein